MIVGEEERVSENMSFEDFECEELEFEVGELEVKFGELVRFEDEVDFDVFEDLISFVEYLLFGEGMRFEELEKFVELGKFVEFAGFERFVGEVVEFVRPRELAEFVGLRGFRVELEKVGELVFCILEVADEREGEG